MIGGARRADCARCTPGAVPPEAADAFALGSDRRRHDAAPGCTPPGVLQWPQHPTAALAKTTPFTSSAVTTRIYALKLRKKAVTVQNANARLH